MHIHIVPNRNSKPAVLLRESYREDNKVKKRTIANLSALPSEQIEMIRLVLCGRKLVEIDQLFEKTESRLHGHVQAVLSVVERLGLDKLIASKRCRERDLIVAAIVARICNPSSKLAMTRWWKDTTLPELLGVNGADEDAVYEAMDWLLEKQDHIEKKLAARHLKQGGLVLYDLTSSYFEGSTCPLAKLGHNRDGKKGKLQVNYGLLTDGRGCPVSVSVYEGNTGDPKTLVPAVEKLRERFALKELVLVGDRGMISQRQINALEEIEGIDWITALKTGAIRALVVDGSIQLGLFDERSLFVFEHPDYAGERLVACRNPALAKLRAHKRNSMIEATKQELEKVRGMAVKGRLKGAAAIGVRTGKVVNRYKMAKHFVLDIKDDGFEYRVNEESVTAEAALDGIYVVRTSLPETRMSGDDAVRNYKALAQVERAFRSLKTMDLKVRPIHHRLEDRVRAHIFLCMLSYYVEWHMQEALRPLLFSDEDQAAKKTRDPVAPAKRSKDALAKADTKTIDDGSEAHSFRTLLHHMSTITRDRCRYLSGVDSTETFNIDTTPNEKQRRILERLSQISV